jgi:hypothetical protein
MQVASGWQLLISSCKKTKKRAGEIKMGVNWNETLLGQDRM